MAISAMGDSQAKATKYHYTAGTQHRCNRAQTGNYSAPTALYCLARGCQSPEWQPEILSGGVFGGPAHTLAIAGIAFRTTKRNNWGRACRLQCNWRLWSPCSTCLSSSLVCPRAPTVQARYLQCSETTGWRSVPPSHNSLT